MTIEKAMQIADEHKSYKEPDGRIIALILLADEVRRLQKILKKVEYCQITKHGVCPCCPICKTDLGFGHNADCELGNIVKEIHETKICDRDNGGEKARYRLLVDAGQEIKAGTEVSFWERNLLLFLMPRTLSIGSFMELSDTPNEPIPDDPKRWKTKENDHRLG